MGNLIGIGNRIEAILLVTFVVGFLVRAFRKVGRHRHLDVTMVVAFFASNLIEARTD